MVSRPEGFHTKLTQKERTVLTQKDRMFYSVCVSMNFKGERVDRRRETGKRGRDGGRGGDGGRFQGEERHEVGVEGLEGVPVDGTLSEEETKGKEKVSQRRLTEKGICLDEQG